jgi:hypothetical protein
MPPQNIESDPLFQLVTDALRTGPGSSEWREAVTAVRGAEGRPEADEYKLLIEAREHLESGRDYRAIRARPEFTHRLLEKIDNEGKSGKRDGLPIATMLAVVAAVAILGVVGAVLWQVIPRGNSDVPKSTVEQLQATYFPTEEVAAGFDGAMPMIPPNWRTIGTLPLEASRTGLRVSTTAPAEPGSGAVVVPQPMKADEPFAAEVKLHPGKPDPELIVEVFVSSDGNFSADHATSASEMVWLLRNEGQRVVLVHEGQEPRQVASSPRPSAKTDPKAPVKVRIMMNRDVAVIEADEQRVWAGPHQLPPNPRHVGVRFRRTGDGSKNADPPTVLSVRVLKK